MLRCISLPTDIDECTEDKHNCENGYVCVNTLGSFICDGKNNMITNC